MTDDEFKQHLRDLILSMSDSDQTDNLIIDVLVQLGYSNVELDRKRHYTGWSPRVVIPKHGGVAILDVKQLEEELAMAKKETVIGSICWWVDAIFCADPALGGFERVRDIYIPTMEKEIRGLIWRELEDCGGDWDKKAKCLLQIE